MDGASFDVIKKRIENNINNEEDRLRTIRERVRTSYFNSVSRAKRDRIMSPQPEGPPVGHYKPAFIGKEK
jgi:hypothetical protein